MTQTPLALQAGTLRHKITIEALSAQPDSFGQPQQTWRPVLTTRARIADASPQESYQSGKFTSKVTHTITLRWPGAALAIAAGMQAVHGSHIYKIQACDNVEQRDRVLKLLCLELNGVE